MAVHLGQRGPGHQARAAVAGGGEEDATPDAFSLGQVDWAPLSTLCESQAITVLGTSAPAAVSISGGEYSVNGGGWTSAPGTVDPGDNVKVRCAAAATVATTLEAMLTIGGVSDAFAVTTVGHAETSAVVLRFATPAADVRRGLIDAVIGTLKVDGVWAKLDAFYMLAAHDAQAAHCNWVQDAFNLTPVNTPVFETDLGYSGAPATQGHLDTGFNDLTGSALWSQDSFCAGAYINLAPSAANSFVGLVGAASMRLGATTTHITTRIRAGSSFNPVFANATPAHIAITRDSATSSRVVRNGVQAGATSSAASVTPSDSNVTLFRSISSYNGDRMACAHLGGALSIAEAASLHAAVATYLTALGAA